MVERFEKFTRQISLAYKYIIKIKTFEMSEYGLKGSNVMCLFFLGKNVKGLTATELCEICMEDKAWVSKSLAVLKEKGYVYCEEKKYKAKYFITDMGKKVFDKISVIINDIVEKAGSGLTGEEREIFYSALDKIVTNLGNITSERLKHEYN